MIAFDYISLLLRLLPETGLVIGGLLVLFLDQARAKHLPPERRWYPLALLGLLTCAFSIFLVTAQSTGSFYDGMVVISSFTQITKICLLILLAFVIVSGRPARFTQHLGEYVAVMLLGGVGLLLLVGSEELLSAFVALELTSLALYLLTGFHKERATSAEGALKYFLFGSVSAAFTLFGISLIFGLAGTTSFVQIAAALSTQSLSPLLIAGIAFTLIGFGFKMAAAPLHLWAPDVYQGAPAPSAALIASASKLASLIIFGKLFAIALHPHAGNAGFAAARTGWLLGLAVLATVSILIGNLLAIAQTNFRRLVAYSAIAHAGYALIAILAANERGLASAVFYMFTYGLAVIGIFAIVDLIETNAGELAIRDFVGLKRRSPVLALCLLVFILSLAGIPPLAGFFGKFYVFLVALDSTAAHNSPPGLLWIVVTAIAASAVSLYYYLQVLKQVFVVESESQLTPLTTNPLATAIISILAAAVVLLGCFPQIMLQPLESSLKRAQVEQHHRFTQIVSIPK